MGTTEKGPNLRTGADPSEAGRALGSITTEKKAAAVRENGKKGGRPPGQKLTEEQKAQMKASQAARRERERQEREGDK